MREPTQRSILFFTPATGKRVVELFSQAEMVVYFTPDQRDALIEGKTIPQGRVLVTDLLSEHDAVGLHVLGADAPQVLA